MTSDEETSSLQLSYPIPYDGVGTMQVFAGDPEHVVLLCPGFPDDHSSMVPLAKRLKQTAAVICLPGYDGRNIVPDGYTYDDWVECFKHAKVKLMEAFKTAKQFSLIVHDWGVVAGTCFVNACPGETSKMILLDVLAPLHRSLPDPSPSVDYPPRSILNNAYTSLVMMTYQLNFAWMFVLQRYVSKYVAAAHMAFSTPILSMLGLLPTRSIEHAYFKKQDLKSRLGSKIFYMMYPYYFGWKNIFLGNSKVLRHFYLPQTVPVLYLFGAEKNVLFHEPKCLSWLSQNGGKSVEVKGAGHWLHWQQPELVFDEIDSFLKRQ